MDNKINKKKDSGAGPIVGSVIIVILMILGAFYLWSYVSENKNPNGETNSGLETNLE